MIYDIYNIPSNLASKYWIIYPYTFRIYRTCIDQLPTLDGITLQDRWNYNKKKYSFNTQSDPFTVRAAIDLSEHIFPTKNWYEYQSKSIWDLVYNR